MTDTTSKVFQNMRVLDLEDIVKGAGSLTEEYDALGKFAVSSVGTAYKKLLEDDRGYIISHLGEFPDLRQRELNSTFSGCMCGEPNIDQLTDTGYVDVLYQMLVDTKSGFVNPNTTYEADPNNNKQEITFTLHKDVVQPSYKGATETVANDDEEITVSVAIENSFDNKLMGDDDTLYLDIGHGVVFPMDEALENPELYDAVSMLESELSMLPEEDKADSFELKEIAEKFLTRVYFDRLDECFKENIGDTGVCYDNLEAFGEAGRRVVNSIGQFEILE